MRELFKEKIGRSLIPHESFLAGSFYGKFFARNLNLYLLQRRPEEWRNMQAERARNAKGQASVPVTQAQPTSEQHTHSEDAPAAKKKQKRKNRPEDEIDAVFQANLINTKKGALTATVASQGQSVAEAVGKKTSDQTLHEVLGAIRAAPKDDKKHVKRKRTG